MKIIALKEKMARKLEEWADAATAIEEWLDTVHDSEIRSIVRWRYIIGCSWKTTARRVYGVSSAADACRKRIKRFFE